jgi:YesN/AraC family two-component response regulator
MDIKMPKKTGLEAQEIILKFLPNVKTIILTAYDDFSFAQNAIRLGVVDYLLKPAKPLKLKESLDKAIHTIENDPNYKSDFIKSSSEKSIIEKALEYISLNFNQNITLDSIAKYVHFNPQYFSRYFKNNTGMNFIDYLSKVRIEESKKLLTHTSKSIAAVSMAVGYVDPGYFSKVFIKYEGISPHKFRYNNKVKPFPLNN